MPQHMRPPSVTKAEAKRLMAVSWAAAYHALLDCLEVGDAPSAKVFIDAGVIDFKRCEGMSGSLFKSCVTTFEGRIAIQGFPINPETRQLALACIKAACDYPEARVSGHGQGRDRNGADVMYGLLETSIANGNIEFAKVAIEYLRSDVVKPEHRLDADSYIEVTGLCLKHNQPDLLATMLQGDAAGRVHDIHEVWVKDAIDSDCSEVFAKVLELGWRGVPKAPNSIQKYIARSNAEKCLKVLVDANLPADLSVTNSLVAIDEVTHLDRADHFRVMLTGENMLTAALKSLRPGVPLDIGAAINKVYKCNPIQEILHSPTPECLRVLAATDFNIDSIELLGQPLLLAAVRCKSVEPLRILLQNLDLALERDPDAVAYRHQLVERAIEYAEFRLEEERHLQQNLDPDKLIGEKMALLRAAQAKNRLMAQAERYSEARQATRGRSAVTP